MIEKVDPDARKFLYLEAFRKANPGLAEPLVTYENGWWCFRHSADDRPSRYRTIDFELMTQRLAAVDKTRPKRCAECSTNYADPPSDLCPGCEAYREHTR